MALRLPLLLHILALSLSISQTLAAPSSLPLNTPRTLYTFPNGTWLENLAVRSNGNLLITSLAGQTGLYELNPFTSSPPALIFQFPAPASDVLGIAEVTPDFFAVIVGSAPVSNLSESADFSVWSVDFHGDGQGEVRVDKIVNIPTAALLNGMTLLPSEETTVLISDSHASSVYKLNVATGAYSIAIHDPTTMTNNGSALPGINGLHVRDGFLYYTNSVLETFNRVRINADGSAAARPEVLVAGRFGDDFAFAGDGSAFVAENVGNGIYRVVTGEGGEVGESSVVVVSGVSVEGCTAVRFGRTEVDAGVAYVTTSGGLLNPIDGPPTGGKVVAVRLV